MKKPDSQTTSLKPVPLKEYTTKELNAEIKRVNRQIDQLAKYEDKLWEEWNRRKNAKA